jgi:hypothetical protein
VEVYRGGGGGGEGGRGFDMRLVKRVIEPKHLNFYQLSLTSEVTTVDVM